jgi:phosphatidylserine decarboxylase
MSAQEPQSTLVRLSTLTRRMLPGMHPAGRPFVAAGLAGSLGLRRAARPLALPAMLLTGWLAWFFRVPTRVPPARSGIALAAADGTVSDVTAATPPAELGLAAGPLPRVSVFLSVFDVHVQRLPLGGEVVGRAYRRGKFLSADTGKASEDNERNSLAIRDEGGRQVVVSQIAGFVARRITCSLARGDAASAGAVYGLIRFGSRVDVYLPAASRLLVEKGQRTIGGETVLAELPGAPGG